MKGHCFTVGLLTTLVLLVLSGLAGPVAAGEQAPFRGRLEGAFTNRLISPNPPTLAVLTLGRGHATHLGRFVFAIQHEVNLATQAATGTIHFLAANGDLLVASFTGQGLPSPKPGVLAVVEVATITGGTGRFAGATGRFTMERLVIQATSTTTGSFNRTTSSRDKSGR
jgi:hypothetical protein